MAEDALTKAETDKASKDVKVDGQPADVEDHVSPQSARSPVGPAKNVCSTKATTKVGATVDQDSTEKREQVLHLLECLPEQSDVWNVLMKT